MGAEAKCKVSFQRATAEGTALLETHYLQFRSADLRLKLFFKDLKSVTSAKGLLKLETLNGPATFALGAQAEKWAQKILNPPSRLTKLGVKPGMEVALDGEFDELGPELQSAQATTSTGRTAVDLLFLECPTRERLTRIPKARARLKPAGALWIVYPKGAKTLIGEVEVINAGRDAGLRDVKVCSFSDTHTALKFVISLADRKP
jgi:hypothetical protein